jgi:hypothetical protein
VLSTSSYVRHTCDENSSFDPTSSALRSRIDGNVHVRQRPEAVERTDEFEATRGHLLAIVHRLAESAQSLRGVIAMLTAVKAGVERELRGTVPNETPQAAARARTERRRVMGGTPDPRCYVR